MVVIYHIDVYLGWGEADTKTAKTEDIMQMERPRINVSLDKIQLKKRKKEKRKNKKKKRKKESKEGRVSGNQRYENGRGQRARGKTCAHLGSICHALTFLQDLA